MTFLVAAPLAVVAIIFAGAAISVVAARVDKGTRRLLLATGAVVLSTLVPAAAILLANELSGFVRWFGVSAMGPVLILLLPAIPWYPYYNPYGILLFWLPASLMLQYVARSESPAKWRTAGLGALGLALGVAMVMVPLSGISFPSRDGSGLSFPGGKRSWPARDRPTSSVPKEAHVKAVFAAPLGSQISGVDVAKDGTTYVAATCRYDDEGRVIANSAVYALDASHRLKWRLVMGRPLHPNPTDPTAAGMAAPNVAPDGTIYVGSDDGRLYAVSPSGRARWSIDGLGPYAVARDGTVYAASSSDLCALDGEGRFTWRHSFPWDLVPPMISSEGDLYGFDLVDRVRFGIYAMEPDGSRRRSFEAANLKLGLPEAVLDGRRIYVVGHDTREGGSATEYLVALDSHGEVIWKTPLGKNGFTRAIAGVGPSGTIYVASDGNIQSGNPQTNYPEIEILAIDRNGKAKWRYRGRGTVYGPIDLIELGSDGSVVVPTIDSIPAGGPPPDDTPARLYAVGPDGRGLWAISIPSPVTSIRIANGAVYVGTQSGKLYIVTDGKK